MSHSLYRQGTYDNLSDDFVVLASPGKEFKDFLARIDQFRKIGFRNGAVNVPGVQSMSSPRHLVYDSKEKVCGGLGDLAKAGLELSVLVSGLRDQVAGCCQTSGLTPHTVNQSFGFWGRTEKLPPFSVLEITTMCGHGRVAPNLVWDMADKVERQGLDVKTAARKMGRLCLCNIFNEVRAAKLLKELGANLRAGLIPIRQFPKSQPLGKKDFGVTIDDTKCTRCLECLPYCPVEAIVEFNDGNNVGIDAERCTECGLCRQSRICPVNAIVAMDLAWPRSLRGKFQHPYAPYRSAPTLTKKANPVSYSEEMVSFPRRQFPSEHTNDVDGVLRRGEAIVMAELGRPHLGTSFRDVQKVAKALVPYGLDLRRQYPASDERSSLAEVTTDAAAGTFMPEILDEKVGWVVLKLVTPEHRVPDTVRCLRQVSADIYTVFALGIVSRAERDGSTISDRVALGAGVTPAVNCKTNVGLGRPLAQD